MKIIFLILSVGFFSGIFAQNTGMYNGTENLQGDALKTALHNLIKDHVPYSYDMVKTILAESDADPAVSGNVICVYSGFSRGADTYGTAGDDIQREHVWAKSHGDFGTDPPEGSDAHNLKPEDASVNASKSNLDFDNGGSQHPEATDCYYDGDSWEPRDEVKGDVARIIFYMATRYEGESGELNLEMADYVDTYPYALHGKKSTLLQWNNEDPVDEFEMNRNNVIEGYQKNRNPFIDNPNFANLIWNSYALPDIRFGNFSTSPEFPTHTSNVTVSVYISTPVGVLNPVTLYWGTSLGSITNAVTMTGSGGTFTATIPVQPENTTVYYKVTASNGSETETSIMYKYLVPESFEGTITTIQEIQGETASSPFADQIVSTTGVVTGVFSAGYFIQDGTGPWSGLYIFDSDYTPNIGDSIVVTGTVTEYYNLTELKWLTASYLCGINKTVPAPLYITTGGAAEMYESVVVGVTNATCEDADAGYGMWTVNDGSGTIYIHNTERFSYTPTVGLEYTVTGPLNYTYSEYKIEIRNSNDVQLGSSVNELGNDSEIRIYPNPANDQIFIELKEKPDRIDVFNSTGMLIKSIKTNDFKTGINLAGFDSGLYFLRIFAGNNIFTGKFLRE